MTIRVAPQRDVGGLFIIDDEKQVIIKRLDHIPLVAQYEHRWPGDLETSWMREDFWPSFNMKAQFPIPTRPISGLMEFKGKLYVNLGDNEGYRKWRYIEKLEDSHDILIQPHGEEDESDS